MLFTSRLNMSSTMYLVGALNKMLISYLVDLVIVRARNKRIPSHENNDVVLFVNCASGESLWKYVHFQMLSSFN